MHKTIKIFLPNKFCKKRFSKFAPDILMLNSMISWSYNITRIAVLKKISNNCSYTGKYISLHQTLNLLCGLRIVMVPV